MGRAMTLEDLEARFSKVSAERTHHRDQHLGIVACTEALTAARTGNYGVGAVLVDPTGGIVEQGRNTVFFPKRIRNHGTVGLAGARRVPGAPAARHSGDTRGGARQAEAELLRELKAQAAPRPSRRAPRRPRSPAPRVLRARHGGARERARRASAASTTRARAIEALCPSCSTSRWARSATPTSSPSATPGPRGEHRLRRSTPRSASGRVPTKPSTINRDLRTLRAALKKARPDYRFPGRRLLPRGRDARPVAPARGGAARARADAVALPGDRQAGGAHAHAA